MNVCKTFLLWSICFLFSSVIFIRSVHATFWIISSELTSSSLFPSSAISNLLLNSFTEFLISVTAVTVPVFLFGFSSKLLHYFSFVIVPNYLIKHFKLGFYFFEHSKHRRFQPNPDNSHIFCVLDVPLLMESGFHICRVISVY